MAITGFQPFTGFGAAAARQAAPTLTPQEEESFLSTVGQGLLTGLGGIANLIDLPASMLRDVFAGENPLDQFATPFQATNRTSWASDEEGNFSPWGLLGEIAFDPLTYLTFGASALTKAGKGAAKAGLLGNAQKALGRDLTKRQALSKAKLDDVLNVGNRAENVAKMEQAVGGPIDDLLNLPLRGKVGVGIPFMSPAFTLGEGTLTGALGGKIGNAMKLGPVGRYVSSKFAPSLRGADDIAGQTLAPLVHEAGQTAEARARDIATRFHEQTRNVPRDELVRYVEEIAQAPPDVAAAVMQLRPEFADVLAKGREFGQPTRHLADYEAAYFPRGRNPKINAILKQLKASGSGTYADARRGDIFKNIVGGTDTFERFAKDAAGKTPQDIALLLKTKYANEIPDEFLRYKSGKLTKGRHAALAEHLGEINALDGDVLKAGYFNVDPVARLEKRMEHGLGRQARLTEIFDAFADKKFMGALPKTGPMVPVYKVFKQMGLNLTDKKRTATEMYAKLLGISNETADLLVKRNGWDTRKIARAVGKASKQSTSDVLAQIDQTTQGALPRLLKSFAQTQDGAALKAVRDTLLPKDFADSLVRMYKGEGATVTGKFFNLFDKITSAWKFGVLTWPAYHVRNLFSGQFRNFILGMFSPKAARNAARLIKGEALTDWDEYAKLPWVKQMLSERRLSATPENVSKVISQRSFSDKVVSSHLGEAASLTHGAGTTLRDFQRGIPGEIPFQATGAFRQASNPNKTWKFWRKDAKGKRTGTIRGIGADESTNIAARFSDDINYFVESSNRLTPWLKQIKQGVDPAAAAKRVMGAQLDYSAMTKFQRDAMLRLFPFGRFFMRNTPFVLKNLWEKPGGAIAQLYRTMHSVQGQKGPLPQHVAESLSLPVSEGDPLAAILGTPDEGQRYVTGLGVMEEDVPQLLGNPLSEAISRSNPLVKWIPELWAGESSFQVGPKGGRELSDLDPTWGRIVSNITGEKEAKPLGGDLIEYILGAGPLARLGTTLRTLTDPRKDIGETRIPGPAALANVLTGIRVTDVSPAAQDAVIREQAEALMKDLGAKSFERTYFPLEFLQGLPPAQQQQALTWQALMNSLAARAKERKAAAAR